MRYSKILLPAAGKMSIEIVNPRFVVAYPPIIFKPVAQQRRKHILRLIAAAVSLGFITLMVPGFVQAQNVADKIYKTNCVLCHGSDGSGSSPSGKALKAQDLRSELIQKKTDAELTTSITQGKGKMPAFGKKLKPDGIAELVAYIRALPKK